MRLFVVIAALCIFAMPLLAAERETKCCSSTVYPTLPTFLLIYAATLEGCEILFPERSLWREYRWQILGAIAVLLFQTALIGGLLIERERRQRATAQAGKATEESGQHRENLAHLVRVHTVCEMSTAIAHEINQPLAAIKNYAFAAQRWLTQVNGVPKVGELLNKIEEQASRGGRCSAFAPHDGEETDSSPPSSTLVHWFTRR